MIPTCCVLDLSYEKNINKYFITSGLMVKIVGSRWKDRGGQMQNTVFRVAKLNAKVVSATF